MIINLFNIFVFWTNMQYLTIIFAKYVWICSAQFIEISQAHFEWVEIL